MSRSVRGPVAVGAMAVFGIVTGAALAQDSPELQQQQQAESSTFEEQRADPTTTSDPPTNESTDPETTNEEPESTTTEADTTSDEPGTTTDSALGTTTESTEVIAPGAAGVSEVQPRGNHTNTTTNQGQCPNGTEVNAGDTSAEVVSGGSTITFTFTWSSGEDQEDTSVVWTASAPFTGEIVVKSGEQDYTTTIVGQTEGTITSDNTFTNAGGKTITRGISHLCIRPATQTTTSTPTTSSTTSTPTTSSTTSTPTTSSTTSTPTTSSTTSTPTTSSTTSTPTTSSTTSTPTTSSTTSTPSSTTTTGPTTTLTVPLGTTAAGTTAAGGAAGDVAGGGGGGKAGGAGGAGAAAGEARAGGGGLPFTGLHLPLLILLGVATAGAGVALKRKLDASA